MATGPTAGLARNSNTFSATGSSDIPGFGDAPYASGPYAGSTPNQLKAQGLQWDALQQKYVRSPTSAGQQAGQYVNGYLNAVPSLNGLMGSIGGAVGGTGTGSGSGSYGGVMPYGNDTPGAPGGAPHAAGVQGPDPSAAMNQAFARAKDQAGQLTRASLDSLASEMGANNMLGSGGQMEGMVNALTSGTNLMGKESSDEMQKASDIAEQNALAKYSGDITQRGQDIGQQTAYRGQDVQAQEAQARLALESRQQIMSMLSLALNGLKPSSGQAY